MSSSFQQRSVWSAFRHGLLGRCPKCGEGALFRAYLKVAPQCPACGLDLTQYRSDDGPAYFTILIIGHLVVAPMLFLSVVWTWPTAWLLAVFVPAIIVLSLVLLPRVKGAFVGVQWAVGDKGGV